MSEGAAQERSSHPTHQIPWWLLALVAVLAACDAAPAQRRPEPQATPPPDTFFAVLGFDRRIVEVATATGAVGR